MARNIKPAAFTFNRTAVAAALNTDTLTALLDRHAVKADLDGVLLSCDAAILAAIKSARSACGTDTSVYLGIVEATYGNGANARLKEGYVEGTVSAALRAELGANMGTIKVRLTHARKVANAIADPAFVTVDKDGDELSLQALYKQLTTKPKGATVPDTLDTSPKAIKRHVLALIKAGALGEFISIAAEALRAKLPDVAAEVSDAAQSVKDATAVNA